MPQLRVGNQVRVLNHNGMNKVIPIGDVATIRAVERERWALLEGDDLFVYPFHHLEFVADGVDEDGPEVQVEWMDLTSYVVFYVNEEAIERGLVREDVMTAAYSDQEEAEQEIEWFREHNYKILANKKLTTRIPKP